ncbi:SLC13 family permease [Ectothiorhodospira sp. 9100]|uniref:SLC13 family permease n=1 Tax=Ectothiorhodospira sp. 9100 TaxID=2897388 RepID=UPI001EE80231|nr:SLC13 family permease [Ectothiorhodospira sp. 9100]MCG5516327.1 SLC13 family permease [Ectothiorhodospira sp. 9100]
MSESQDTTAPAPPKPQPSLWRPRLGLALGPIIFATMLLLGPPGDMAPETWAVASLTALMAIWWVSEAIPIPATALLPVTLLPLLGASTISDAAAPYANPMFFLFLGGFMIALAIQRWNLHRRIALLILGLAGKRLDHLVAGFIAATAGLSMWVSNTATAALMLPIGISVLVLLEDKGVESEQIRNVGLALLLGIAFGANIGGMATLIGTPPNALLAAYMTENYDVNIGFVQWMMVGLPLAITLLIITWWVLCRWAFPVSPRPVEGIETLLQQQRSQLGAMTTPEKRVALVFLGVALAWICRPLLEKAFPGMAITDAGIAIAGALALFLIPANFKRHQFLLDWESTRQLPWGVLVLVGGGLSLGTAIGTSGLSDHVATALSQLSNWPTWTLVGVVALSAMLLSHVTSNTATAATVLPLAATLAVSLGHDPLLLAIPVALAASCAFMLPVATPPNAIVFSSERITVPDMVNAGWRLSLISIVLVTLAVFGLAMPLLGGGA